MRKFKKTFATQDAGLQAFIKCACYDIQCGCDDIYDPVSVQRASDRAFDTVSNDIDSNYN